MRDLWMWPFDTRGWYDRSGLIERAANAEPVTPEEQVKMAAEYMRARYGKPQEPDADQ